MVTSTFVSCRGLTDRSFKPLVVRARGLHRPNAFCPVVILKYSLSTEVKMMTAVIAQLRKEGVS